MSSPYLIAFRKINRLFGIPGYLAVGQIALTIVWRMIVLPSQLDHIHKLQRTLAQPEPKPVVIPLKSVRRDPLIDWGRFPGMNQLARVHLGLHHAASTSGFALPEVHFRTQVLPFTPLERMDIDLAFTATYMQFKQWLAMLMVSEPAMNVQELSMHRANAQQSALEIKVRLRWYALREEGGKLPDILANPALSKKHEASPLNAIKERFKKDKEAIEQTEKGL